MMDDEQKAKHNARRRAARKADNLGAEIAIVYEKPLDEWDDEEIARGRPRASDGTFRGNRPKWLTPALQAERQRRLRQLMADELATFAGDALRIVHAVMMDDRCDEDGKPITPTKVRLDAAVYLLDQFIGKAKVSVDLNATSPLEELMAGILVNPDDRPSHIITTEIIDLVDDDDKPSGPTPPALN